MAKVAIIYYSATGNVHRLAHALEEGARAAGAQTRLRHVEELAPEEAIAQNDARSPRCSPSTRACTTGAASS